MAGSDTVRPGDCRKSKFPWLNHNVGYILHYCFIVFFLIPLFLACLGALVEALVYTPSFNPHYHVKMMPLAGMIAAPISLLRIFWRWPEHTKKLALGIYIVQCLGYFNAVVKTVLVGKEYYLANRGIRHMFTTNNQRQDLLHTANTEDRVWLWLEHVLSTVYSTDSGRSLNSRPIAGSRLRMLTSLKLRQHRVNEVCCSTFFNVFHTTSNKCTQTFSKESESKAMYGTDLKFNYSEVNTVTASGHKLDGDEKLIQGTFGKYSLCGFSTFFTPGLKFHTALNHLHAMRNSGWIDFHTRAIVVEMALTSPDFLNKPVWAATTFLIERDFVGRFIPAEPTVHFNFNEVSESPSKATGGATLSTCEEHHTENNTKHSQLNEVHVVTPDMDPNEVEEHLHLDSDLACKMQKPGQALKNLYLEIFPIVVYTMTVAIFCIVQDWRAYLSRPFHFSEIGWVALLIAVLGMYITAFRRSECAFTTYEQPTFHELNASSLEGVLSRFAPRSEFLPLATTLTDARRFLAISIFVHIFNGLQFLIRLKALGVMVRTLYFSALDLISFSVSFFCIFFAFVVLFNYTFGLDVEAFQDMPRTIAALWVGMLGEIVFTYELSRSIYWAISLYIFFTFISAFVLLTLIISIIGKAHNRAMEEASKACADITKGRECDRPQNKGAFTNLVSEMAVVNSAFMTWKGIARRIKASTRLASSSSGPSGEIDEQNPFKSDERPAANVVANPVWEGEDFGMLIR